jgi:hypothetical protein
VRDKWTDERLDDLNGKVGDLGERIDLRFDSIDRRMDLRFDSIDRRFERMDSRFDDLGRSFVLLAIAMATGFVTLAGLIVGKG